MTPGFSPEVAEWFKACTLRESEHDLADLVRAKTRHGQQLTVCLPALEEEATIGKICRLIRQELMEQVALVDELVVIDSGSRDSTADTARSEGAIVHQANALLTRVPITPGGGKGDALWRSLEVTTGDIILWLDSDTQNFSARFVVNLAAPLILDSEIVFAKAFYRRPLSEGGDVNATEGARVTEVLARPLLQTFFPELSGFIQPLSGEYAIRKSAAMDLPFFSGYGVDVGLLIDVVHVFGLARTVQVDLTSRVHRNRDIHSLGRTAHQVMQVVLKRAEDLGRLKLGESLPTLLTQFGAGGSGRPTTFDLAVVERPSVRSVSG